MGHSIIVEMRTARRKGISNEKTKSLSGAL
jgi:hypothetical protein